MSRKRLRRTKDSRLQAHVHNLRVISLSFHHGDTNIRIRIKISITIRKDERLALQIMNAPVTDGGAKVNPPGARIVDHYFSRKHCRPAAH